MSVLDNFRRASVEFLEDVSRVVSRWLQEGSKGVLGAGVSMASSEFRKVSGSIMGASGESWWGIWRFLCRFQRRV